MRAKKPTGLVSTDGAVKLLTHALMGAALGLTFALALMMSNPRVADLINHGEGAPIFVLALVTTFAIGATLTGIVFMVSEAKDS